MWHCASSLVEGVKTMSTDYSHGGGENLFPGITALVEATEQFWPFIKNMASTDGDIRTGVRFAVYDSRRAEWQRWQVGDLVLDDASRFQANADNKCLAMAEHGVVCSGMVANPEANPPIYDGGIRLNNGLYFAASGLRAELDRVFCMISATEPEFLDQTRNNTILFKSPNEALVRTLLIEVGFKYTFSQGWFDTEE